MIADLNFWHAKLCHFIQEENSFPTDIAEANSQNNAYANDQSQKLTRLQSDSGIHLLWPGALGNIEHVILLFCVKNRIHVFPKIPRARRARDGRT